MRGRLCKLTAENALQELIALSSYSSRFYFVRQILISFFFLK